MSYGRGDLAVGTIDGEIFSIAGEEKYSLQECWKSVPVKVVERFNPPQNMWFPEDSIPDNLFRFNGASYNSSLGLYSSAIYLFGGQTTYNDSLGGYPIKNTAIRYFPASVYYSHNSGSALSAGGIAGIVIAGIVVLAVVVVAAASYCVYMRQYRYHSLKEDQGQGQGQGSLKEVELKQDRV